MKHLVTGSIVVVVLVLAAVFSVSGARDTAPTPAEVAKDVVVDVGQVNPWTSLKINNETSDFQFAIVTDRTGGERPGVFGRAVKKINLLQPEFVMSVGDLIQGGSEDPGVWALEWAEFEERLGELQMPFFFCPGNHDIGNKPMSEEWKRKFGRTYYHFLYRGALFIVLNTEEPRPKENPYRIGPEQQAWVADVLAKNVNVRWTFVFFHKPTWTYPDADPVELGWAGVEKALGDRKFTVFAGHKHNYARYVRNGHEYYMLATTGGGSKMRGLNYGEFDHFVWVTMKPEGPVLANLLLDGVEDRAILTLPDPMPGK